MSKTEKMDAQTEREFHEKLNAQAAARHQQEEDLRRKEAAAARAAMEARRMRKRRKAVRRFSLRMITCVVLWLLIYAAQLADLVAAPLAIVVGAGVMVWAALWLGAFWQFMWPEGGLFDGE